MLKRWELGMRAASGIVAPLLLASCANQPPVVLSSQFAPPSRAAWLAHGTEAQACRIRLVDFRDLRSDPEAMGVTGGRLVRSADTVAWLRSGFETLGRDRRLHLVDAPPEDIALSVDVLKAYAMSVTGETRAATVVVRVRYSGSTVTPDEQIYRGTENGLNWSSGEGETQSSFDAALAQLLEAADRDLVAHCAGGSK